MNQRTGDNFRTLIAECQRINPPSLTGRDVERKLSVTTEGIDLAIDQTHSGSGNGWNGKRVLILGCGDGYEVAYARTKGWNATGLTFLHDEAMERVRLTHDLIVEGDMHALPFAPLSFDAVYSKETLEHSPCPILALIEMNRVLKTGGEFFHLIPWGWDKQRDWYHFSCLDPSVWSDLFRKAYLRVEKCGMIPNCDRCTFGNVSYYGRKFADRVMLGGTVQEYKDMLEVGETRSSEGLR